MENNSKKGVLVKMSIIFMAWLSMADNVVTPIAMDIVGAFPDISNFQLNFILSGSMLICGITAIIVGKLAQYISKKTLLIIGFVIYIVSGLAPIAPTSLSVLMLCRGLTGVACGFLGACAFSLIAQLYQDEVVSSTMMGFYNSFSGIAGIIISTVAGVLALTDWHYAFIMNAPGILCLILIIAFIPSVPPEGKTTENAGIKEKIPGRVFWYTFSVFVYCALCMPAFYFVSMYVTEAVNGSSAVAGVLSSMLTLGSFIIGLLFGQVFKRLRLYTETMFYFLCAAALVLLFFVKSSILAGILIFFIGIGYGACLSYYYMVATIYAPPTKVAFSTGMINAALSVGCFACTYVVVLFQNLLKIQTYAGVFMACGVVMAIFGVFATILASRYTRREKLSPPASED